MSIREIAIIGDRFMLSAVFERALSEKTHFRKIKVKSMQLEWPDVPMNSPNKTLGVAEFVGNPDVVMDFIGGADILINHLAPITRTMLPKMPNLQFIAVTRGGPVNMDMDALAQRGITVVNTPGRNASAVAEFTVGMILTQTRRIILGHEGLRRGKWRGDLYRADITGDEMSDLTVGIVGYGKVGGLLAKLLRPFECRILAADPYAEINNDNIKKVTLNELLRESDIVTLNARVTPETTGMIGHTQLAQMKNSAFLINAARGPLMDYDALHDALINGTIAGAALDTFAVEPPAPNNALLQLPNVILSPHIAGASRRTIKTAAESAVEEIRRHLAGEPPLNPC